MAGTGRICLYCSNAVHSDHRVTFCEVCFAVHHEACWQRNARCSTFACRGVGRTMLGSDVGHAVEAALVQGNGSPAICPTCGGKTYSGGLCGAIDVATPNQVATGLAVVEIAMVPGHRRKWWRPPPRARKWLLPGARIVSRSCGQCHALYVWGQAVQPRPEPPGEQRLCIHCAQPLVACCVAMHGRSGKGARFECDGVPEFSSNWLVHQIVDRFVRNSWDVSCTEIAVDLCPDCLYTQLGGRPVYRLF